MSLSKVWVQGNLYSNGTGRLLSKVEKVFYTERINTDIYSKHDTEDDFKAERLKYKNIHFEDLTIDFNRSPQVFTHE